MDLDAEAARLTAALQHAATQIELHKQHVGEWSAEHLRLQGELRLVTRLQQNGAAKDVSVE